MANPWFPFYSRDYVIDTGHLSLAEHGAYLLLICHYYATAKPLPANACLLHRVCRCTSDADRATTDQVLGQFFVLDGDVYRHNRIDRELVKAAEKTESRRAAANARHHKADANAHANDMQMHTQPQPQPQETTRSTERACVECEPRGKRKKPSAPPNGEAADPRHESSRKLIQELHQQQFGSACPWEGSEGAALKRLLDSNPSWTQESIAGCVRNRFASEGVNGDRPREWLPNLSKFAGGPLDRYGKALGGNGNGKHNRAEQRQLGNLAALDAAYPPDR